MRRILVLAALLALAFAPSAFAKTYRITNADERFAIAPDGSVHVTEKLTFAFNGTFHGAYRLIPSVGNESISDVHVSEGTTDYSPGANAAVGSSGSNYTYGVALTDQGWTQVAWHFLATNEARTFTVAYVLHGYVRAYADVDDLYVQVWGKQWPVPVDRLHAEITLQARCARARRRCTACGDIPRR